MEKFVKLSDGETLEGTFLNFGKNIYGVYMLVKTKKETVALNIQATVLKNIIKMNLDRFNGGEKIKVERVGKKQNKKYILYNIYLNDVLLNSTSTKIEIDELKNFL